jgi:Flp pilus assembly protein TadG
MIRGRSPSCPDDPARRRPAAARLWRDSRGAAAVEFALVSLMFVITVLMVMSVALVLFLNQQLDVATGRAARQIMNGTVQKSGYSSTDFRTNVVCSALPAVFSCADVIVNVQSATVGTSPNGYYAFVNGTTSGLVIPELSNVAPKYSVGVQGSYEYLQVIYPITFLPALLTRMLSSWSYKGVPAYLAVSTAAFRNEQY